MAVTFHTIFPLLFVSAVPTAIFPSMPAEQKRQFSLVYVDFILSSLYLRRRLASFSEIGDSSSSGEKKSIDSLTVGDLIDEVARLAVSLSKRQSISPMDW
ncbi:hypothetical protein ZIOFF_050016 [Zingiber officinale]|uniref:Uncharacterized protein n=1 Tax=Zingiber officinale TaxID=94328 RepID=A0A8J5FI76_ZINOF|nr:hypothetical protein ZIOFF_050016 [Zingiber officinale]